MEEEEEEVGNVFRKTEKRFKGVGQHQMRRKKKDSAPALPWGEVLDFHILESNSAPNRALIKEAQRQDVECSPSLPRVTRMYTLHDTPGFFFIPNPFTDEEQLRWADRCVREYVESPPGVTNLAAHYPASALTHLFCRGFSDAKTLVAAQLDQRRKDVDVSHEQLGNNEGRQREQVDHHLSLENKKREALLWKLRWSTLGYHYDWTSRKYHDGHKDKFPSELASLCEHFARVAGMSLECQAAIVNYYAQNTVLCGHKDDVELTFDAPVISISLGLSAIFLLGGSTRAQIPRAMRVRSGDVVIMGGASRLLYHGVPRILPNTLPDSIARLPQVLQEPHLEHVAEFLSKRRINVNVRQVLPKGSNFPPS